MRHEKTSSFSRRWSAATGAAMTFKGLTKSAVNPQWDTQGLTLVVTPLLLSEGATVRRQDEVSEQGRSHCFFCRLTVSQQQISITVFLGYLTKPL
jgi:hypothetical protein